MASEQNPAPNEDLFETYFNIADLDCDGHISGLEAVTFFSASGLPKPVLAKIWSYVDQTRNGFLDRAEFYNALKLVTVAQSKRELTPEIVKAALFGPVAPKIPPPKINLAASPATQSNPSVAAAALPSQSVGYRPQVPSNDPNVNQQHLPANHESHLVRPRVIPQTIMSASSSQPTQGRIPSIPGYYSGADFSRPSPINGNYDVFISFHGEDTVRYFTTYLCHSLRRSGIHTFMSSAMHDEGDDDDLCLQMILRSRIAIVVYSENYASSRYSMKELNTIMDEQKRSPDHGMALIPIFYKVNPAELRYPLARNLIRDKHKGRVDDYTLHSWMHALTDFGKMPAGLSYKDDNHRDEYAFIDEVVAMIKKQQLLSTEQAVSYEYDVFLSFRGDDTRESFTGTLYHTLSRVHKIKTFMDVIFRKGSKLEELLKMVEKSRISIVVFSENFAESEWCLKELVKIFEERDRRGLEILPVFYKVNPSELRYQNSGKTKEHMDKHINTSRNDSDTIKSWSDAIKELGNSSGYTYWSGRGKQEVELAEEIAQEILTRLHG